MEQEDGGKICIPGSVTQVRLLGDLDNLDMHLRDVVADLLNPLLVGLVGAAPKVLQGEVAGAERGRDKHADGWRGGHEH